MVTLIALIHAANAIYSSLLLPNTGQSRFPVTTFL